MANAPVLKTGGRKPLGVRVPRSPQNIKIVLFCNNFMNTRLILFASVFTFGQA